MSKSILVIKLYLYRALLLDSNYLSSAILRCGIRLMHRGLHKLIYDSTTGNMYSILHLSKPKNLY